MSLVAGQYSKEKAWEWYNKQPWIRGFGSYPSNCVNTIAMWQKYKHEEVFEQIDKELALAKETGFNAVRAFFRFEIWLYEHDTFMQYLDEYFEIADKHGLKIMLVLGNDCSVAKSRWKPVEFGEQKIDWGYHSGIKGGQHAGDYKDAGYLLYDEPEYQEKFFEMVDELAKKYKDDNRLQIWDVWNEIGNSNRKELSVKTMERTFEILRENKVSQPLTADAWNFNAPLSSYEKKALDLSDVITFHYYGPLDKMVVILDKLKRDYDRPIICNEWLNRIEKNDVEIMYPLFYLNRIGCYNWGLVQGFSQTFEPHGGHFLWQEKEPTLDLSRWMHDLYRFNGYPYIPKEIETLKHFAKLADERDKDLL